jgi:soluble lytic murein transglycosylase
LRRLLLLLLALPWPLLAQQNQAKDPDLDRFRQAWQAAGRGDRATFERLKAGLGDYVLFPYLQYEEYRARRAEVAPAEMAQFLDSHADWAFTAGLRRSWLLALGERQRWDDLLSYAADEPDVEVQCFLARARVQRGATEGLIEQAQALWANGKSQPEACDPLFDWLRKHDGITPDLAWLRIGRAMAARNSRLTRYLARYLPAQDQVWLERWQQQELQGYSRLDQARLWPVHDKARDIALFGLQYLARRDVDRAVRIFDSLDRKMRWSDDQRGTILRELAFWSAVAHSPDAVRRLHAVPAPFRDDRLLEWWARHGMASGNWAEVIIAVAAMGDGLRDSDRWRYWDAMARLRMGDPQHAMELLNLVASEATYYGFLAADYLGRAYAICPEEPAVAAAELSAFGSRPAFRRVAALGAAGLKTWSRREWRLATQNLQADELKLAAALATEQGQPDLAIAVLSRADSRNWYAWRFPLTFAPLVRQEAGKRNLDAAWVMGLMRSESAMAEDAVSPANALGLMQVLPATAAQLARRHAYAYRGSEQLLRAGDNIAFGTLFLRELMDRFGGNPVLVLGAYNAGPGAVTRWLDAMPIDDPAIWIENLPYYETRDYIPRVLAFATIYDWRLQQPVRRISTRMAAPDSGTMLAGPTGDTAAAVACPAPLATAQTGR